MNTSSCPSNPCCLCMFTYTSDVTSDGWFMPEGVVVHLVLINAEWLQIL